MDARRRGGRYTLYYVIGGALIGAALAGAGALAVRAFGTDGPAAVASLALPVPVLIVAGALLGARERRLVEGRASPEHPAGESLRAMQSMLDAAGDGFLVFGPDYIVRPECSRPCERIFGRAPDGRRLPDLLYAEEERRQEFVRTFDLYFRGDAKAPPEVIFGLADGQLQIGERVIRLEYRAIDESTVMCALSDVTAEQKLAARVEQERRRQDLILKVVSNRLFFRRFLREADELLQRLDTVASGSSSAIAGQDATDLAARLHTFKANAGFLGFVRTATVAQDLEDQSAALPAIRGDVDLSPGLFVLKRQYYEEYNVVADALGRQWLNDLATTSVPIRAIRAVEEHVSARYPDDRRLLAAVRQFRRVPLAELFSRFPDLADDLAARRGKRLRPIEVEGGEFRVLPDQFEPVASSLTHLVRNMVDHGIEAPAERERKGKDPRGLIRIRLGRSSGVVTIVMSDDGQGVDFAAIEESARRKGLLAPEERPASGRLLALMFESGLSTAETVTAVSGRGVGLDAVRRTVQEAGGTITVETRRGQGTTFRISVQEKEAE